MLNKILEETVRLYFEGYSPAEALEKAEEMYKKRNPSNHA